MTEKNNDTLTRLPIRLKEARREKGLSLEAVANLSGVSRSMLSQIERGESSPTISTLWNLTQALQIDFAGLLAPNDKKNQIEILRNSETPSIDNMGEACRIRILSPPEEAGGHEVYDIYFYENGKLNSKPHVKGAKEHVTVLEGDIKITSGSATSELSQGDTARYAGDISHSISALNGPARIFLIVKDAGT